MQVVVFISGDAAGLGELSPALFLPDYPPSAVPPHPAGLPWRYLATVDHRDSLLDRHRAGIEDALSRGEAFISLGVAE